MNKFKIGDKVKIVGGKGYLENWKFSGLPALGKIGIITTVPEAGWSSSYFIDDNKYGVNFKEEWLEAVEERKFKIGDRVRVIKCEYPVYNHSKVSGEVSGVDGNGKVEEVYFDPQFRNLNGVQGHYCNNPLEVELIDESKPERKEVEHRMANEFKVGDIVRMTKTCGNNEVGKTYPVRDWHGELYAFYSEGNGCQCYSTWELVSDANKSMSNLVKLTLQQKLRLSKEDKALVRLGLVKADLTPTEAGYDYLREYLFEENKTILAEKAEKEIKEIEKEEKEAKKGNC